MMPVCFLLRAQEDGGQRGREGKRIEGGDRDGEGDGQRELLVQNAGGAGKEADRNEDGDEDERGGDDGAGDLGHGDAGGFVRVGGGDFHLAARGFGGFEDVGSVGVLRDRLGLGRRDGGVAGEVALHVFDDDDGVVDDQSCGERDAEEGQRVDGEAEDLDEGKGADERDRDRNGGDDRGAPVLQEEEDDDDDDDDGFADGGTTSWMDSPMTGVVSTAMTPFMPGERIFRALRGRRGTSCRRRGRWRWRAAERRRRPHRPPENLRLRAVVFGADLGAAHVFEQDDSAARWDCS